MIELVLIAFMCGGHVLLEDIPGVGKTLLVKSFAKSIGDGFSRIQFTPDLLPSDLTGINYYNQKTQDFEFRRGPLFSNLILADGINWATPRTQSSLLEAMEELACVISPDELGYVKSHYTEVRASEDVMNYLMDVVEATRLDERIRLGISPRGSLALFRASQAKAAFSGRDYMIPEDIQGMARYVFNHRLVVKGGTRSNSIYEPVERILSSIKVPVEDI